ncbi:MAG: hypothetical protein CVU05_03250 [Bacteroidetes bacterium HGW-Bacteroidetes-21]|jgi:hypothetical protein|nr:MAG: hypothetical protein CVU05_03250 [Bacteroidetes bacterium HGW-Bacteroidetes-21]
MELTPVQLIGYAASLVIALSMTMNSIVKFRLINLVGALTFSVYGFVVGAIPVGVLNAFIFFVDVYYLWKIFSKNEVFETLELRPENRYLIRFLEFHDKEIQQHFPGFSYKPEMNTVSFFILRDTSVAGVFLAHKEDDDVLRVGLDFVIPQYRDFKNGKYVYVRVMNRFAKSGFKKVVATGSSKKYASYLKKLGFTERPDGLYEKSLL